MAQHISLTLWKGEMNMCKNGQAHSFTHLRVKIQDSVKFLSTTEETKVTINDDPTLNTFQVKDAKHLPIAIYNKVKVPQIHSIQRYE